MDTNIILTQIDSLCKRRVEIKKIIEQEVGYLIKEDDEIKVEGDLLLASIKDTLAGTLKLNNVSIVARKNYTVGLPEILNEEQRKFVLDNCKVDTNKVAKLEIIPEGVSLETEFFYYLKLTGTNA